jgi:hypothetical protein
MSRLCTDDSTNNDQLLFWQFSIQNNSAWCNARDIRYTTLIIPERHVIYADKLPSPYAISASRPVIRFLNAMAAAPCAVLYPYTELLEARKSGEVFYKTDEHPNSHGYHTCYLALLNHIQADYPVVPTPRGSIQFHSAHVTGNLGMLLDEEPGEDREFWIPAHDRGVKCVFVSRRGRSRVEIFETGDQTLPRAIIFGDSSLHELRLILAPHFSRLVVVYYCHQFFYDLASREQPDFVFHIMAELSLGGSPIAEAALLPDGAFLAQCGERLVAGPILLSVDFGGGEESSALTATGWSYAETTHTWMVDGESVLRLPFETSQALASMRQLYTMTLSLWPLIWRPSGRNQQFLRVSYGQLHAWHELGSFEVSAETDLEVSLAALRWPADVPLYLRFEHPDGFSPEHYGMADQRVLSFALKRMTFSAR